MPRPAVCLAIASAAATLLACSPPIQGTPVAGLADQSSFFAGAAPSYGRQLAADDVARLFYLRALRRIDVCGLVTGDALAGIGELVSVGTLFAFDECDAELKISGLSERRYVSVDLEVSAVEPTGCQVLLPLALSALPGAPPMPDSVRPSVRVELIGADDCGLTTRIARALADRLAHKPLPPRDAAAAYRVPLAERDPCEVVTVVAVTSWDVRGSDPYLCRFRVVHDGRDVGIEVGLMPEVADVGQTRCSTVSFVGPPMLRRVVGGGYVAPVDVVIKPAVVVDGGDCAAVSGVATQAARLYG